MTIKILITGGTVDKDYDELTGSLVFRSTHVPGMLSSGRCGLDIKIAEVMMADSAFMTDADREAISTHCKESPEDKIVIMHGSDSMVTTAEILARSTRDKTVILTGALVPYAVNGSEAMFNLGAALAFVQTLPHGVYISMNGKSFAWDKARKNKHTGKFEEVR
jgi:L-asparaginase